MSTGSDHPLAAVSATGAPVPAPPPGLLEKLMAAVRPEFRSDVLVFDPRDPVFGGPPCRVDGCGRTGRLYGLCGSHAQRWRRHGRPDLEEFIATTGPDFGSHAARALTGSQQEHGEPRTAGERFDLRPLRPQLRLEIQYALQRRHEEGRVKTAPHRVRQTTRFLATQDATSLLDRTEDTWRRDHARHARESAKSEHALLIYARRQVEQLAYGRGWDVEYPRDVWRLRNLGISHGPARLRFGRIPQPWLKQLAKRWIRWRLSSGRSAGSTLPCLAAITSFGTFLASPGAGIDRLGQIDRAILERYLAELHATMAGTDNHGKFVRGLNAFFLAIRQHGWDDSLPASAMFYSEDFPKTSLRLPRALPEYVMSQVEHPASLDKWPSPAHRLVTLILMRCGLRITDALRLPCDCVVTDADGAPYLRYFNHKMKREALVPIDEELEQQITLHQQRLLERWPAGTPVLFPRTKTNPCGDMPTASTTYRAALKRWLASIDVRDKPGSDGKRVNITPHQWRHTLGTRLINRDVPQEVVRRILDHDSHMMTSHYARLADTTIRRHWEAARKVNAHGEAVSLDPAGPLAEAAWAKQRVSRATQALPNGYCGLPLVQTCPHANSCLTCPMFITTAEFLPQHREHHQQTLQIISAAEARGQARMAEMNRQVATNLSKIIASLEHDDRPGHHEAADAS